MYVVQGAGRDRAKASFILGTQNKRCPRERLKPHRCRCCVIFVPSAQPAGARHRHRFRTRPGVLARSLHGSLSVRRRLRYRRPGIVVPRRPSSRGVLCRPRVPRALRGGAASAAADPCSPENAVGCLRPPRRRRRICGSAKLRCACVLSMICVRSRGFLLSMYKCGLRASCGVEVAAERC